VANNPD
jgi:hypothetical protein